MVSCRVAASVGYPAVNGWVLFRSFPFPATVSLFLSVLPVTSELSLPMRKGVRGFWRSQIANLIKPEMSTSHTVLYHQTLPRPLEVGSCLLHANLGCARGLYLCAVTCVSSGLFLPDHDEAVTKAADERSADKSYAIHSVLLARGTSELSVCWPQAGTRIAWTRARVERQALTLADRHTEKETEGQDECGSCQRRR